MLDADPPEHSSLRAIVNKGFTPRAVAAYEELLRELTRAILDEALPKGEFDFVEEVAKQLPIQVLCRILGVPLEDDERMIDLGDRMIGNTDPDSGGLHPGELPRATNTGCCRSEARMPRSCSTTVTSWRPSAVRIPGTIWCRSWLRGRTTTAGG